MIDMPYFMTNKEWFYFDYQKRKFILTDKAPQKAKKSYNEFYREIKHG